MRRYLSVLALAAMFVPSLRAQDEFDDIYYNPDTDKNSRQENVKKQRKSAYIADFSSVDVDSYNRRDDFYYESQVDTIGRQTENGEDFVYTQQIQRFYNPTIVVDNADVLADVLEDSYGNVDIVIDNGIPYFSSVYTGSYCWAPASYYNWCLTPSWSWSWGYGPAYVSWNFGPSWGWGYDPWYWGWNRPGWGPSWGWGGPGWIPAPAPRPYYSYHRPSPGATRPVSPGHGWSSNTRPGGNYNGVASSRGHRVQGAGNSARPNSVSGRGHRTSSSSSSQNSRPAGVGNNNSLGSHRNLGTVSNRPVRQSGNNNSLSTGTSNHRTQSSGNFTTTPKRNYNSNSTNRTYNSGTNNHRNSGSSNRSYNSGSNRSGGGFSTGGSRGGGSRGGGGHRTSGGRR